MGRGRRRPKDPPRDAGSGFPASSPWCRRQRETTSSPRRPTRSPSECGARTLFLHAPSCAPPEYADHAPCDLYVRATDWLEVFVLRLEADVVALTEVALDRRLSLGFVLGADDRHDDVAIGGRRLLAHDDRVAIEDARVLHRVAADLQDEIAAVAAGKRRHLDVLLDVLLSEDRRTGGDAADEGEPEWRNRALGLVGEDLHRAGLGRIAPQHPQALEVCEVRVHRRRRSQPDRLADVADGGRVPLLLAVALNELVDLPLTSR